MAIRTFSSQERYKEEETEPRKKPKRVRSIKVANLDRLRSSMRRGKSRFNRGVMTSLEDAATEPSESSSAGISCTSSPNYMKATTSSSARKGSLLISSGNIQSSSASSSDIRSAERQDNPASKLNKVSVQECSDPVGVNIPVIVKSEKSLKRVPSLKHSKKLSSKKSMKIRARYSQFPDASTRQDETSFENLEFRGDNETETNGGGMEIDPESPNVSVSHGQGSMVKTGTRQRGILERSRSRKLARIRSIRSSKARQKQEFRFSGGATELLSHEAEESNAEPHYMKGTSSQELKKNSDKGLTRTSSLRPLRILAKIPSLRSKRSKVRKRPQATSLSGTSVDRATCSSILKRTELPDDIELHSRSQELEETSSHHVCAYSYCSIHGHRHHAPSQLAKESRSAKRKLFSNQKGEKTESQSSGEVEHHHPRANETDHSRQIISDDHYAVQEVMNATTDGVSEAEDNGIDFLVKIYAKPRKKWSTEGTQSKDAEVLNACPYDEINVGDYEGKLEDSLGETSGSEETQEALNADLQEKHEGFKQQQNSNIADLTLPSDHLHSASSDFAVSSSGDSLNIFSDKQKYTSMWQLIHQQLLSSEASMNEATEDIRAEEKEAEDGNSCCEMSNLDPEQSEYSSHLSDDVDAQISVTENLEPHQTAAIKLVQEALNAILQRDAESYNEQSNPVQEMASIPISSQEETCREVGEIDGKEMTLASAETEHNMKHIGNKLLQKEQDAQEFSGQKMSKSLSKLRKMFVTAKFIKAMERLKKIAPHKPQHLSVKPDSEDEGVNLRHLSMNEKKNTEEWMLDSALRQVISRLDTDQQIRVAQLVEAFETVIPEQEEKGNRRHPMKSVLAPGGKLTVPMIGEKKQSVEPEQDISLSNEQVVQQQDGVLVSHDGVPQKQIFKKEHEHQAITTGDKNLQKSNETNMPDSTLVESSETVCVDSAFDDGSRNNEEPTNTVKVPPQFLTKNSEVNPAGDMTTVFFNKQNYKSMWNMIYKHVVSTEASISENQQVNGFNEERDGDTNNCQEMNDRDSVSSDYSMDQNEEVDNQSAACEKPELDQSAAIKLVKEALGAILSRYEQENHLQPIPEHYSASDDTRDLYISTPNSSTEENSVEGGKKVEKHTYSDVEDKVDHVENTNVPLQQQVECGESKAPQRKMSKSLSKLKKAIATARFIKAMERLSKSSPRKSQNLSSDATSEDERVYLRHRSMDGRKNGEEWMLDFALRQVISKMAPDQQRRVVRLVEAFETVHPEQKGKDIQCYSSKGEAADQSGLANPTDEAKNCYLKSQQQRFTYVEQVSQKQKDGSPPPTGDASLERSLEEDHDQQVSAAETTTRVASLGSNLQEHHDQQTCAADDIILQEIDETATSESAMDLSGNGTKSASVVLKLEEPSIRDKQSWSTTEVSSLIPTDNSEVKPDDNMPTILFDKRKYTSMWHLIHQHVLLNEASKAGNQEVIEVDEDKQSEDKCQEMNDPESTQSMQLKESEVEKDNQSADLDQSAAINLVKEAINAVLQHHEQTSDQQSLNNHGRDAYNTSGSFDTTALAFTKENSGEKRMVKQGNPEPEEKLHKVEVTNAPFQQQVEAKKSHKKMPTSISKLKKAIATAKFIKAMERLRKINPRKLQHLSAEMASEEERVHLRPLSINERKNDEEWMLDYALRKVLSDLAPEEQRKVVLIVEAFETVSPEQKGIRNMIKSEWGPTTETESVTDEKRILESKHDNSTSNDEDIPPMHNDRLKSLNIFGKGTALENSKQEDHSIKFPNHSKIIEPDAFNLHIHHQGSSKGSPISNSLKDLTERKEEIDANLRHEPLQLQYTKDPEQDTNTNATKGIFGENKKKTSMWHLIYQHVESITAAEAESKMREKLANDDHVNRGSTSPEMIADADSDDSDTSSMTSELTENDATQLVRDAINDILNAPEDPKSSNGTTGSEESQRAAAEERPKSLSKGYSKLRKLIICNKFIKAMEKTRKRNPQKLINQALNFDSESRKTHLKTGAVGDRKGMDEWMLDNVLQKVIAELAPVQQKRVSLLVEAFEKVPDSEQRGKGLSCSKTEFLDTKSLKEDPKEKEDTISLTNARCPDGFGIKLNESTTSSKEVTAESIPQEICTDSTSGKTKEYALNGENWSDGPCNITATTSDAIRTLSDACNDRIDLDEAYAPHVLQEERAKFRNVAGAQGEEGTLVDEELTRNAEKASKLANKPLQPENLKDEWNYSAHKDRSSEKSTSLWGLILQQVTTDMLEKKEAPKTGEVDVNAQRDNTKTLERRTDDSSHVSFNPKSCRDMGVQTPTSFEFEENEAIKLVEEAVEEILLLQDQISDTNSTTSSMNLEQEIYSPNNGDVSEPSLAGTETTSIATSTATPEEGEISSEENLPKSYSTLSKVILCKRFVKAMDKMRKLKALSAQDTSQPPHTKEKGIPSLRQISTNEKASWEEGTLDNALQKVIGNLAPAKKQRVALLVQAFETVGSTPESTNSSRGKGSIS